MGLKFRIALFTLIVTACLAVGIGYVKMRVHQVARLEKAASAPAGGEPASGTLAELPETPLILFRTSALGKNYGQLVVAPLDEPQQPPQPTGFRCDRAYFAGGYGVCLTAERGVVTSHQAFLFDRTLQPLQKLPLQGFPSRTRVSPDGRHVAITVFVSGDSYAPGTFSTRTEVFRTSDGSKVAELEQFTVERDGKTFRAVDFNYWGVTFAKDGDLFYATLASGGQNYLIEGDLVTRHARVLHSGVECPSLAPDGRRVAFKRLAKSGWHIYVVDLDGGKETPLAEQRSIDDQVEWLDDNRILYAFDQDLWVMSADGSGTPAVFLRNAYSPAVVR